jgi:hypothetical protein
MSHTVELLELALGFGQKLGYTIRHEFLGGSGGGGCELRGRKYLFIDLALHVTEQFEQVCEALRDDPQLLSQPVPMELRRFLIAARRKAG